MKILINFLFGQRTQGEPVSSPKLRTILPSNRPTENEWAKEVKFGNRYGHRGSFYNKF